MSLLLQQRGAFKVNSAGADKKKGAEKFRALMCGGPNEDRTHDLRIANAALSQLSYRPEVHILQHLLPAGKPQ